MRIAVIADSLNGNRTPECLANWHAARRAVARLGVELTIHLGHLSPGRTERDDDSMHAARRMQQWPTPWRCAPGRHGLGGGSGAAALGGSSGLQHWATSGTGHWSARSRGWMLLGIDARVVGRGDEDELALWRWIEAQTGPGQAPAQTALFLHGPVTRRPGDESACPDVQVARAVTGRLTEGPLKTTLRCVIAGPAHGYLDTQLGGVRHLWMPPATFIAPDGAPAPGGRKLVGIGVLELGDGEARFDLWCPDGISRHGGSTLAAPRHAAVAAAGLTPGRPATALGPPCTPVSVADRLHTR